MRKTAPNWDDSNVYQALADGRAWLFVDEQGFLIVERYPGDDGQGMLFVLALEGRGYQEHKDRIYAEIDALAKHCQCRVIRMISPRKGWMRDPFWKMAGYVYEHEVTR